MPLLKDLANVQSQRQERPKVILLGSGGLSIGQAGEFDYSGTQAIKAMQEEGMDVVVINPNIATVQTNPGLAAKTYLYPVEPEWVEKVIEKEKPTAIAGGFGGQTGLNCLMKLEERGVLAKYGVINLGTPVDTLRMTEDRDRFAQQMRDIGMPIPPSAACSTMNEALRAAKDIGYPMIVRAAYALGGLGSGFAHNEADLRRLVETALSNSPQVLLEKSLQGWKEVEYEVMRDSEGNAITICNMENFDPLGIHTGDSIVVCPSQSLSDDEYQILRNAALKIVDSLGIVGECNVQYALDPESLQFYVIEVNARLSRSSALASKASGYPIAYIAAKVVLGYDLLELKNPVTGITYAFYEPALDYVTVKIPRWDLKKFPGVSRQLGSQMKSVGEVMSIGRTFPEALQKAVRMVTERGEGLSFFHADEGDLSLEDQLNQPTDERLYVVMDTLRKGMDIEEIYLHSHIDPWFLSKLREIVQYENEIKKTASGASSADRAFSGTSAADWRNWKLAGFGDEQIAYLAMVAQNKGKHVFSPKKIRESSLHIREQRKSAGVRPVVKKIDTTAAEYPSPSNYLYMSYAGMYDDPLPNDNKEKVAMVLGGGSYRVGTSVEFDWCAVSCSELLQRENWRSVMINCNPETVSTDYNSSDRLYFEELTFERVLDIADFEKPTGAVVSMGGQLPNRLALPLAEAGIKLLGHSAQTIDTAEDRSRFSALLDDLKIDQPFWVAATSKKEIENFVDKHGFPILVRPSYVLSGAAMKVAYDRDSLEAHLNLAVDVSEDYPVVLSEFIQGAREIELDGVAKDGEVVFAIVSEHVENAGVHSGDATLVCPAQKLYVETVRRVRKAGRLIAKGLKLNGPFNIQFIAQNNHIRVIECNARAARSFPFVSKVVGINLAEVASEVMLGKTPAIPRVNEDNLPHVGVKAAMFSFTRLGGADPILGVEMASTGEVGCLGHNFDEALLLALQAAHVRIPQKGVLVSSGPKKDKVKFLRAAEVLKDFKLPIYATGGTAEFLNANGFKVKTLPWPGEGRGEKDVIEAIREGAVDLVINIPKNLQRKELTHGSQIRQAAARHGRSLITNMEVVTDFMEALLHYTEFVKRHDVEPLPRFKSR